MFSTFVFIVETNKKKKKFKCKRHQRLCEMFSLLFVLIFSYTYLWNDFKLSSSSLLVFDASMSNEIRAQLSDNICNKNCIKNVFFTFFFFCICATHYIFSMYRLKRFISKIWTKHLFFNFPSIDRWLIPYFVQL